MALNKCERYQELLRLFLPLLSSLEGDINAQYLPKDLQRDKDDEYNEGRWVINSDTLQCQSTFTLRARVHMGVVSFHIVSFQRGNINAYKRNTNKQVETVSANDITDK